MDKCNGFTLLERIELEAKKALKDNAMVGIGTIKDRSKSAHHNKTLKSYAYKERESIENRQAIHEHNKPFLNQPHHENRIKILKNDANNPSGVTKPINVNYHWSVIQIIVEPPPPIHFNLSFNVPCIAKTIQDTNFDGTKKKLVTTDVIRVKESRKLEDIIGDVGKKGLKIELCERPNMSQIWNVENRNNSTDERKPFVSFAKDNSVASPIQDLRNSKLNETLDKKLKNSNVYSTSTKWNIKTFLELLNEDKYIGGKSKKSKSSQGNVLLKEAHHTHSNMKLIFNLD